VAALNSNGRRGTSQRFIARYRWDGSNWIVEYDEPDISTYGRTLAKAMTAAREALAVTLDYRSVRDLLASVDLEDHIETDAIDSAELASLRRDRQALDRQLDEVAVRTAELAGRLVKAGMSYRDTATAVGLSHQRIAQIVSDT